MEVYENKEIENKVLLFTLLRTYTCIIMEPYEAQELNWGQWHVRQLPYSFYSLYLYPQINYFKMI